VQKKSTTWSLLEFLQPVGPYTALMMYSLNHIVLGCLFVLFTLNSAVKTDLEVVNDDELLNLIRTENHVVVLFSKYSRKLLVLRPVSTSHCRCTRNYACIDFF
jgi:hypothetical protein